MDQAVLQIVMRYIHIVSVVLIVGGMAFISFCVRPSLRLVEDSFRESLLKMMGKYFDRIVLAGIGGLLVSGIYNWVLLNPTYSAMKIGQGHVPIGQILIGSKVLLAAIMFAVVFARVIGLIRPSRFWHMFNLHLAAIVILLGAILRYFRLQHLQTLIHP